MPDLRFDDLRFDAAKKGKAKINDHGYLETEATVTRTGVFLYKNADGSTSRELRHPDDVFKADSLATLKMIPLTDGHQGMVTAKSAKELQNGHLGENVRVDGKFVDMPLVVTTAEAIKKVESGKNQLSLGYTANMVKEDGIYNGEPYDWRQTDISYNHVALCKNARAGAEACIRMDSNDAVQIANDDNEIKRKSDSVIKSKEEGDKMPTIKLDGIDYEASAEVINSHNKKQAKIDELQADVDTKKVAMDALSSEKDVLQAKQDEYEANFEKTVFDAVSVRTKLIEDAKSVLKKHDDLDGKSNDDIKAAVIKEVNDGIDLTEKSPDYISARFDAALEMHKMRMQKFAGQNGQVNGGRADSAANTNPLATAMAGLQTRTMEGK